MGNTCRAAIAAMLGALALCPAASASSPAAPFDPLPMQLPAPGAHSVRTTPATWILGIRPSAQAQAIASRYGAKPITESAVSLPTGQARQAAEALRRIGALVYAEPDVSRQKASAFDGAQDQWARAAVVAPTLNAPTFGNVKIGIIDEQVDATHPDLAGHTTFVGGVPMTGSHGTMVASVAAATAGNGGVIGVFPGVPILSYGTAFKCSDTARGINKLVARGVRVINISLGSPRPCVTENIAVQLAIGRGVIIVAAAGNEFEQGNPPEYPASYPHVLSVAAINSNDQAAGFSTANAAVDVSAPGIDVPVAVPVALDTDGTADGVSTASGTSFAAPMVAGAAAWLVRVRSRSLTGLQIADIVRYSARDIGEQGWDRDTGWGAVNLAAAITQPAPPADPGEPNDDIPYVNGTYFAGPDPVIYNGKRKRKLWAAVDVTEDPVDVYRISVPAYSSLRATLTPSYGDADLYAFRGTARTVINSRSIIRRSERRRGSDRVFLRNTSGRVIRVYLVVAAGLRDDSFNADYSLTVIPRR